jgi:MFS family permease
VGRVVLGYGVGLCSGGVPLYISEIAPAKLRGRIIGIEQMVLCFGELIAFCTVALRTVRTIADTNRVELWFHILAHRFMVADPTGYTNPAGRTPRCWLLDLRAAVATLAGRSRST